VFLSALRAANRAARDSHLPGADVSAFVPFTIYVQAMLADAAAPKHLTLSNLLALHNGE
jgi:hypothetical protein